MNQHELFKAATDFVAGNAPLPEVVAEDPRSAFLAAMLRDLNAFALSTNDMAVSNEKRIISIEDKLGNWWKWVAGTIGTLGILVGILARLGLFG